MKKIILKETQVKNIIKSLLSEQSIGDPSAMGGKQTSEESWQLCSYEIIKRGGDYYIENSKGQSLKLPLASQITGRIEKDGISFDDEVWNGIDMGREMKHGDGSRKRIDQNGNEVVYLDGPCFRVRPMQYEGASTNGNGGSWFVFIDDLTRRYGEPTPVYSIFTWDGSLGTGNSPVLERYKDKRGVVIKFNESRTPTYILEISPALAGSKNEPGDVPPPPPTKKPEYEEIKLDIQSPFEFDKTTLTPEAEVEFKKFVEKIKANYQGVSGNVEVIASASIDGDEDQKRAYNQKLSDNRASTIANRLKTETGITTLNFIPKGIGQTDQFAKGLKYPEVTDSAKTAPNRRLIIKMPTLTREKK